MALQAAKNLFSKAMKLIPLKNTILFESVPDYSDNTKAVFDEMVRRGLNKKYKFIWVCSKKDGIERAKKLLKDVDNVGYTYRFSKLYWYYYRNTAKAMITCNLFLKKSRDSQYYIYLAHGCALKNASGKHSVPVGNVNTDVLTLSDYLIKYDSINLCCDEKCIIPLGYPRIDRLFDSHLDFHQFFENINFDKVVYWLPTYRQHNNGKHIHSDISIPIIHNVDIAKRVNAYAKEKNILLLLKVHPAQDISKINQDSLSHIIFITNDFLDKNGIDNYEVLGSCDALLTDYSSVYYDYLICNKPIGLCWEDFEEYNQREGFTVDIDLILSGGEKIYTAEDLFEFLDRLNKNEDCLKEKREKIRDLVHKYQDNKTTERVVNRIEEKLKEL